MLHREVEGETLFQGVNVAMKVRMQSMEHIHGDKPQFMALLADIESRVLPERKMENLEERFRTKVNFLAERGRLDPAVVTIVKTLHRHHNARPLPPPPAPAGSHQAGDARLLRCRLLHPCELAVPAVMVIRGALHGRCQIRHRDARCIQGRDVTQDVATQLRETVDLDEVAVRSAHSSII
jgi:hypothetical protein